ncbi:MAG TPA: Gfo/Idh/MocA family oxidoreductase [Nitrospira sp.]|nr:Gfo/Idh/MocA family oxidoreductase [Nitrospira sp.]
MKRVRVALIGCGWFARAVHLPILTRLRHVEVVALAESDPERLEVAGRCAPMAERFGAYHDLLRKADAEAAIIDLPTSLHAQASIAAMQRGMHVYLEKPIATDLEAARAIVRVWRQAHVVGMIGFNYRRNALHQSVKAIVQVGTLGRLVGVRSVFSAAPRASPSWKSVRREGGGALMELGSHHFDLFRFCFGQEVRSVTAEVRSMRSEDDTAMVQLLLADGLQIQSWFALNTVDEDRLEILGDAAKLSVDRYRSICTRITTGDIWRSPFDRAAHILKACRSIPYLSRKLFTPWHEPSYRESVAYFLDSVRGRTHATPDLLDGYRSLEIVCAAEISARTRQAVSLDALTPDL